jgi:hypothetical protein
VSKKVKGEINMKSKFLRKTGSLALCFIMAAAFIASLPLALAAPNSSSYGKLLSTTNFANAGAADGWTLEGAAKFSNGGLLLDKQAKALSQAYSTSESLKFIVDFSYSGNTQGERAMSLIGFAKDDGERSNFDPKFVVFEAGFQVHQEGAFGRGDHWLNFDGASYPLGTFSDKYTLEIIVEGAESWFTIYDKSGKEFWRKESSNSLNMDNYKIYMEEESDIGQTVITKFEVYTLGGTPSGGGQTNPKTNDAFPLILVCGLLAVATGGFFFLLKRKTAN